MSTSTEPLKRGRVERMTNPRPLTLAETAEMRRLVGNAYDNSKRDLTRCRQQLEDALRLLDQAGHSINRG